ncbi:sensor histidine kinase [Streptomyces acidicola]|uniref:sensor histidine kinase n=1 Tax=Streptomyces acidicola TaxID=2596892 RepID=UPI00378894A5
MTLGGFRGGAIVGAAALFSAIAGGATGSALRIHREHWRTLEERAESAIATREIEATRRVTEERLRIARDLHDVIGHQVAMLSMHLGAAEIGLPEDAESSRQALVSARSSARTVVVETQRILALLRLGDDISDDEALRPTPALSGLEGLVASFESIGLDVRPSIDIPAGFVEPSVGVTVYRVVQEALTMPTGMERGRQRWMCASATAGSASPWRTVSVIHCTAPVRAADSDSWGCANASSPPTGG